jgi:hypothetical protein
VGKLILDQLHPYPSLADLTAVQKIASDYILPLILLALMGVVFLCHIVGSKACKKGSSFAKCLIARWRERPDDRDDREIAGSA